jgi:chemotaxis protein methyltransferase CheR
VTDADIGTDDENTDGSLGSFDRLTAFIEAELQFATSHYNDSYLKRRFASRMRRRGIEAYSEYHDLLVDDYEERQALLDALSINVTGFFRNPDVWNGVREVLRETSVDHDGPVTVWSAGCADGREPYSVAMLALDDPRIDHDRLTVVGSDINEAALDAAREGVYCSSRTVDIDDQLRYLSNYGRFVARSDEEYRVRDRVRDLVHFEHHDLINDDHKSEVDVVLCRNLFIYIDSEYKRPVLGAVKRSMRPGGALIIGKAETIPPNLRGDFEVVDGSLRIYRRR